jgi:hypothetical protein
MMEKNAKYIEGSRFNERTQRFISAALVSLMMAAAGLTIAQFGHQIFPEWNGWYLPIIAIFIAIERFYSHRIIKKQAVLSREWAVRTSTQWIVNLIVLKLIVTLSNGFDTLIAEIPQWQKSFAETFFNAEYIVSVIFIVLVWIIVGAITEQLDGLGLDSALVNREVMSSLVQDQAPPRQRLMATVFAIGGALMFLTAAGRVDTRALFANEGNVLRQLSPLEGGGAGTLLYFLFGFVLLSQAQFITLNTRWFLQGVPVSRSIAVNWAIYAICFLGLLVFIVSVLPTNYSLGLLSVIGYLIDLILGILIFLMSVILTIVGFLISLPFMLFGLETPVDTPSFAAPPPIETPNPVAIAEGTPFPWLDLIKSMFFWGIFLIIIGYSIVQYLRQHEEILIALRKIPGWKLLSFFWDWISGIFKGLNRGITNVIQTGRSRLRSQQSGGQIMGFRRLKSLRRLSTRQKVFFYYHALLRRGNETGLSRIKSQTPEEYATALEKSLPTVEEEIGLLTDAFSEARYSQHAVQDDDVRHIKNYWEQIRRVFRGKRG